MPDSAGNVELGHAPGWRPFAYFNLYRLILVGLSLLLAWLPGEWSDPLRLGRQPWLLAMGLVHFVCIGFGVWGAYVYRKRFNAQLSLQVAVDVVSIGILTFLAGGVGSGLALILLFSLAAASLVGTGRLVLFYAAMGTIAILGGQIYGVLTRGFEQASIVHAGFISASYFATAILARLLGRRAMLNEDLAKRRGEALHNEEIISQRIIERMQDGVLVLSADRQVVRANPFASELLGRPLSLPAPLAGISVALDAALMAGGGSPVIDFVSPAGRAMQARLEPTTSSHGEQLLFIEDVERLQERAQQFKLAALGRLTASIAHEIRNPLAAISHASELLREEQRIDIQERLVRIVGDNVARLDRIVKNVLELGRRDRIVPEVFDLHAYCANFVESFCAAEHVDPATITLLGDTSVRIEFDPSHLQQVLSNLLANALNYSRHQHGSVQLRLCQLDGRVELHVQDDGHGVPAEVQNQIFEPFFTTRLKGTGLGLFLARELCEANRASLRLMPSSSGGHFMIEARSIEG